jgi:hypothetical protein
MMDFASWGWDYPVYEMEKNMFETTNQYMGVSENVVYPKYGYI